MGGFQTVQLNLYGWSALVGAGAVLGALVAWTIGVVPWLALILGVVIVWGALLALDHIRWRNTTVHLCRGGLDAESGFTIVTRLEALGISATYREYPIDEIDGDGVQRGILCQRKDVSTIERMMTEHLATEPDPP